MKLEKIISNDAVFNFPSKRIKLKVRKLMVGYRFQEKVTHFDNDPINHNSYFLKEDSLLNSYEKRFLKLSEMKIKEYLDY